MKSLAAASKKGITQDWLRHFPGLGIYKPMWLGRIVGPFFQGVFLERDSGNRQYLPTTHIHPLCKEFPVISLTLAQPLKSNGSNTDERISASFHGEHLLDAVDRLRAASFLPLHNSWGLGDLVAAVDDYEQAGDVNSRYPVFVYESAVDAAIWGGDDDAAKRLIDEYGRRIARWPNEVSSRFGGSGGWISSRYERAQDPNALRRTFEEQCRTHKVQDLVVTDVVKRLDA